MNKTAPNKRNKPRTHFTFWKEVLVNIIQKEKKGFNWFWWKGGNLPEISLIEEVWVYSAVV